MSDVSRQIKGNRRRAKQLNCKSRVFLCCICIFVLLSSIYVISEIPGNFIDKFNAVEETFGTDLVGDARGNWDGNYNIKGRSRLRRSLPSNDCNDVNNSSHIVAKENVNASCNTPLRGPSLVQNVTSRRHEVYFPVKISNVLDILLQQAVANKLKGKQKRTKPSTHKSKKKAASNLVSFPTLYVGGYVKHPKKEHQHDLHHTDSAKKRTTTEGDNNSTHTNSKHKTDEDDIVPVFPEDYHASGLLILPHSGIAEPFEIWYAPSRRRSRIDYYYGTDKTYQLGDNGTFGSAYKYVPMYNDRDKSFDGCWTVGGTQRRPIIPQIITPNITWFKYNGTTVYTGTLTTRWVYQYYAFGMRNSQTVWVTKAKPNRPIRYEMFGFDTMLGSYYDHYVIEYISFEKLNYQEETFEPPQDIKCFHWGFSLESSLHVNPMQEFAAFSPEMVLNLRTIYESYKAKRSKRDKIEKKRKKKKKWNNIDNNKRLHVFNHHARLINSHNRKNATFKLKPNHFVILTPEELEAQHGQLEKDPRNHAGILDIEKDGTDLPPPDTQSIPHELDWREYGAVSRVKGQGICGACYAFTAAGAAEGAWYRKTGKLVEVSSQQILDCSWGYGNHGCKGGHYATGLSWIYTHGISTDRSYGKFLAQEGYCHFNDTWFGASIDGFSYIQPWNTTALKIAVAKYGPIAVSINTRPLTFKFYSHGIYNDPKCVSNQTTHSALVVGYGKAAEVEYWIVKNSWSSTWGENGFIKVAMRDHLCGITEYPVAVVVYKPQFQFPHNSRASANDVGVKIHPKVRYSAKHPLAKFNPTLNMDHFDNNGGSTTTYYNKETHSNKQTKPLGKHDQDTQSRDKGNNEHKEKELINLIKSKDGEMPLLNDTNKVRNTEDEKKVDGLSYMGSRDEDKDGRTFNPDKQNDNNVAEGDDMMEMKSIVHKEHLEDSSSSGETDVNETKTTNDNENDLKDNMEYSHDRRVNLTLSLFKEGIFNTKLFDALLKDEKGNGTNNTNTSETEKNDNKFENEKNENKLENEQNENKFENDRKENNVEQNDENPDEMEEGRSEVSEVKVNKTDTDEVELKMKKTKEEEGKINEKLGEIEKELQSNNVVEDRKEERRKALLEERQQELRELQVEEKRKALLEERREELEEVEKEKNASSEQQQSLVNSSKNDDVLDVNNLQEKMVEQTLKEINKMKQESKEDQDGEQSIEHEVTKEARRRNEKEEEKKVELEEAWKSYIEKERKKEESKQNTSVLVVRQKSSSNKSKFEMKDETIIEKVIEKLKNNSQTKEINLNENVGTFEDDSEQYGQDDEPTSNEDAVEVRMKRLLHQQREIHKLISQLQKLHVTGDKKSRMFARLFALHPDTSVDPEKIGLYSITRKRKKRTKLILSSSSSFHSTALKKYNIYVPQKTKTMPQLSSPILDIGTNANLHNTSTILKKYNIYVPQKTKTMPRLFSPIHGIDKKANLLNFDEKKRRDKSRMKQFVKVNRKITKKMRRIGININKTRQLISTLLKMKKMKKIRKHTNNSSNVKKAEIESLNILYSKIEHDLTAKERNKWT